MRSVALFFTCIHVVSMTMGLSTSSRVSQHFDYEAYTAKRVRQLVQQILPTGNILQLATSLGETEMVTYLDKTGLATSVSEITPLTLFGPTNAAFDALAPAVRTQLDHNPAAAYAILSYHIAEDEVLSSDFVNEQLLKTKLGLDIRINVYPFTNATTASGRPIQVVDNVATNGVLHELSALMLPPGGTLSQVLAEVPDLSILLSAIKAAGMSDMLSAFEPYTLFAPTNQAFQALPADELSQLLRNTTRLQEVLGYHVARGTLYSAGIGPQMTISVLTGSLTVVKEGSMVTINKTARVIFSDLSATNGVVHLIDSVLSLTSTSASPSLSLKFDQEAYTVRRLRQPVQQIPTENILQLATSLGETELVTYLNKTGLATSVGEGDLVTVFGPTNAAFDTASVAVRSMLVHNPATAHAIMAYHIVDGRFQSSDFVNEQLLKTKLGLNVRINVYPSTNVITASGRPIQVVDKVATNGILHELSAVMLPPGGAIPKVLSEVPDLSILLSVVKTAGMTDQLSALGPFTLFAPTNHAFHSLPAGELSQLLKNTTRLREVLSHHVAKGMTYSAGIEPQMTISVLNGALNLVNEGSIVNINNASSIIFADLNTSNGVIHLIDSVLFLTE